MAESRSDYKILLENYRNFKKGEEGLRSHDLPNGYVQFLQQSARVDIDPNIIVLNQPTSPKQGFFIIYKKGYQDDTYWKIHLSFQLRDQDYETRRAYRKRMAAFWDIVEPTLLQNDGINHLKIINIDGYTKERFQRCKDDPTRHIFGNAQITIYLDDKTDTLAKWQMLEQQLKNAIDRYNEQNPENTFTPSQYLECDAIFEKNPFLSIRGTPGERENYIPANTTSDFNPENKPNPYEPLIHPQHLYLHNMLEPRLQPKKSKFGTIISAASTLLLICVAMLSPPTAIAAFITTTVKLCVLIGVSCITTATAGYFFKKKDGETTLEERKEMYDNNRESILKTEQERSLEKNTQDNLSEKDQEIVKKLPVNQTFGTASQLMIRLTTIQTEIKDKNDDRSKRISLTLKQLDAQKNDYSYRDIDKIMLSLIHDTSFYNSADCTLFKADPIQGKIISVREEMIGEKRRETAQAVMAYRK